MFKFYNQLYNQLYKEENISKEKGFAIKINRSEII